ncbi:MAG: DUF1302 domain-containing protein [Xanthomonadales bacterium]|nr:DUF1302 domain-containing protein [Xanthomonadales bacterium]
MNVFTATHRPRLTGVGKTRVCAAAAAVLGLLSLDSQAYEFSSGEWSGSFDTTVSYGASWRVKDFDPAEVGKQAPVNNPAVFTLPKAQQGDVVGRWSANGDDGNLNYRDKGDVISNLLKVTAELGVRWRNFGGFFRGTAFYDFENADKDVLSEIAQERVGKDARLLDAYVYGEHAIGDHYLSWRLGTQVVSWGESTFIQGGLNVINPVDVSKLRLAGSELKEAFEGINMIWGSVDLSPSLALEALYMFEYEQIIPDPAGTYFSTNDIATPGASYAMLGFVYPQPVINPDLFNEVCLQGNLGASDSPLPTQLVAAGCGFALPRTESKLPSDSGQFGLSLRWFLENLGGTELGFYFLNYHSRLPLVSGTAVSTAPPPFTNSYFTEFPEDIQLYGVSFNSTIGTWALAGEVTYRPDAPLQIDDVEVLFAGLTPLNLLLPSDFVRFKSQLGEFAPGATIQGFSEHESWQAQSTTTKLFGPNNPFRANQIAFVTEVGFNYVADLPDKEFLRFNGDGTDTGGGPNWTTGDWNNPATEPDGFADDFSWGYRVAARLDYNSAFGGVTVSPRVGWSHDVHGTTPGPGGAFVDGRKQLTLGLAFNYLNQWVVDFAYTTYSGGGKYNLLDNRDFFAASVSYSF